MSDIFPVAEHPQDHVHEATQLPETVFWEYVSVEYVNQPKSLISFTMRRVRWNIWIFAYETAEKGSSEITYGYVGRTLTPSPVRHLEHSR